VIVLHSITVVCPRLLTVGDSVFLLAFLFNFVRCPCNVFDVIVSLNQYTVTYLLTYLLTYNGTLTTASDSVIYSDIARVISLRIIIIIILARTLSLF